MTAKDKAKELLDKFKPIVYSIDNYGDYDESIALVNAKSCALIAVDEILNMVNYQVMYINLKSLDVIYSYEYWEQVKQEIIQYKLVLKKELADSLQEIIQYKLVLKKELADSFLIEGINDKLMLMDEAQRNQVENFIDEILKKKS